MAAMAVLVINLETESSERIDYNGLSGFDLSYKLFSDYEKGAPVVITAPSEKALAYPGSAFFTMLFTSPISGKISYEYSGLVAGYSLFRLGYEAIVIIGRMRRLGTVYLSAEGAEFVNTEALAGFPSQRFEDSARKNVTDVFLDIGRAGENGVLFASVQSGGHEVASSGLGFIFGEKNLKGICLPGFQRKDHIKDGKVEKRFMKRLEKSCKARSIKREGDGIFIDSALRMGWLPVRNYRERFNPRAYNLDGKALSDSYGVFPESCLDCPFLCGRRTSKGEMLPSWDECIAFGSNIGIFSLENVRKIADAAREEGLGIADAGALLAYLRDGHGLEGKSVDEIVRIVHMMGNERIVNSLREGVKAFSDSLHGTNFTPMITDPRGDTSGALLYSIGMRVQLAPSILFPKKPLSSEVGAMLALYETAYRCALVSLGYSPLVALVSWWERFPAFIYRSAFMTRLSSLLFRSYGIKGISVLERGIRILDIISSSSERLPERFTSDPESSYNDGRTVEYTKLVESYESEKARALRICRFINEKQAKKALKKRNRKTEADKSSSKSEPEKN